MGADYDKASKSNKSTVTAAGISAVSAIMGDLVSSIVKVPREVITARLQVGADQHLIAKSKHSPAWTTLQQVIKEQGTMGLFRGFWSTTLRDCPFMVILFTTYESFKINHHVVTPAYLRSHPEDAMSSLQSTLFGGVSGALAGFLTVPFDVSLTDTGH
jgi:solute carrier family 25 (mitochondrial S-adenosylmethionine transporter), member 26